MVLVALRSGTHVLFNFDTFGHDLKDTLHQLREFS